MNMITACSILDIEYLPNKQIDMVTLKRQYRRKALQYHPDKNNSVDACSHFHEIRMAYEYLLDQNMNQDIQNDFPSSTDYKSSLFSFMQNIWCDDNQIGEIKSKIFYAVIHKIANCYENKALDLLMQIDKSILIKINDIFIKYKDVFYFSDDFLNEVDEIIANKVKNDQCIILNPFLEDLFENNLYKLKENDKTYIIPLWHDELVYDNSGCDLYVKCSPILPENVFIDQKNNVNVHLNYQLNDLWGKEEVVFEIANKSFSFYPKKLKFVADQIVVLEKCGISRINSENIFDVSKKGDVIIHLHIV